MDTVCSNIDRTIYSNKDNIGLADGLNEYTKLILSKYTDETTTNFEKLAITNINKKISCKKNNNYSNVSNPVVCKNNIFKYQNNDDIDNDNQIINCSKITLNTFDTRMHNKQNIFLRSSNKKQQNISFSKEQLWEMNRVNQILHKKISSGIKPTFARQSPTVIMKATSTINREKRKKDIIKGNEVSFT